MPKVYRYAMTFFKFPTPKALDPDLIYFIAGEERTKTTNKLHWQAYGEFHRLRTRSQIKKFFNDNTVHIQKCRGSTRANIHYCSKDGKVVHCLGNPASLGWRPSSSCTKSSQTKSQKPVHTSDNIKNDIVTTVTKVEL